MKKISHIILIIVIITSLFPNNGYGQSLDTVKLQLKWKHQFQFAGYYAAVENGYYKDMGLYVDIIEADDNTDVISSVLLGESDFGIATSDLIIARNKNMPLVIIANIFQHSPYVFITLQNDESDNIHDLAGKSIMLENHAEELLAYLKSEQINIDSITFIPHSYSINELLNGDVFAISAYSTDEPYNIVDKGYSYNTFNPRSSSIDFYGDLLFTSELELKNNSTRVEKFLEATKKGWYYALNNEEIIIDLIYNKYSKRHSKEHLRFEAEKTKRLIMPDVIEIGYINPDRWMRIGEIYSELGMIPPDFSIEGFLYSSDIEHDNSKLYLIIASIFFIAIIISIVAVRFFRLNQKLRNDSIERQNLMNKLQLASNYKDKLFSIISHDLRGPIGTLNSFLELLTVDNNKLSTEQQNRILLKLKESSKNTYAMLENLLLWALNQRDQQMFNPQKTNICLLITNIVSLLTERAHKKGITISTQCNTDFDLMMDSDMIAVVIRNLITNAIKYSNLNSKISILVIAEDKGLTFSISDTGIGIDPKVLTELFDFERINDSFPGTQGEKGTGLGLILCKEFISEHNGRIWAQSSIGKGSTFYFFIPA